MTSLFRGPCSGLLTAGGYLDPLTSLRPCSQKCTSQPLSARVLFPGKHKDRSVGQTTAPAPAIGVRAATARHHHPSSRHPILVSLTSATINATLRGLPGGVTQTLFPEHHHTLLRPQWWHLSIHSHTGKVLPRYCAFPLCLFTAVFQFCLAYPL